MTSISELLRKLKSFSDIENCEREICANAEKKYPYKITRAAINLPETILPMAIILSNSCSDPEKIFSMAMSEGGASSPLTSLSASITTAFHGLNIPENLLNNLINKKKIFTDYSVLTLHPTKMKPMNKSEVLVWVANQVLLTLNLSLLHLGSMV